MAVRKILGPVVVVLMAGFGQMAEAVPIVYLGTLQSGVPVSDTVPVGGPVDPLVADYWQFTLAQDATVTIKIGRASCREECVQPCRSRWSPYH